MSRTKRNTSIVLSGVYPRRGGDNQKPAQDNSRLRPGGVRRDFRRHPRTDNFRATFTVGGEPSAPVTSSVTPFVSEDMIAPAREMFTHDLCDSSRACGWLSCRYGRASAFCSAPEKLEPTSWHHRRGDSRCKRDPGDRGLWPGFSWPRIEDAFEYIYSGLLMAVDESGTTTVSQSLVHFTDR